MLVFLIPGAIVYLWFGLLIGQVSTERVIDASRFIVQIDSFLTAGFFVGVFSFWNSLLRRISEIHLPFSPSSSVVVTLVFPFTGFALSAFLSIGGILTGDIRYLEWGLFLTAYALVSLVFLIDALHKSMGAVDSAEKARELQSK